VTDQDGTSIFNIGGLDENYHIDPKAHRMGGYMLGEDGKLVDRNRVWQIKEKVVERAIPLRHSTYDDYTFRLPEDVSELQIEAFWMFRKLNQEFMDWAYGKGKQTVPLVITSEMFETIPIH